MHKNPYIVEKFVHHTYMVSISYLYLLSDSDKFKVDKIASHDELVT
jgi:hypothetical protein